MGEGQIKYVRAKQAAAVRHPDHGGMVVPKRSQPYRDDDPLVLEYPWLFEADTDHREAAAAPGSVAIETATRAPGERRATRRGKAGA